MRLTQLDAAPGSYGEDHTQRAHRLAAAILALGLPLYDVPDFEPVCLLSIHFEAPFYWALLLLGVGGLFRRLARFTPACASPNATGPVWVAVLGHLGHFAGASDGCVGTAGKTLLILMFYYYISIS